VGGGCSSRHLDSVLDTVAPGGRVVDNLTLIRHADSALDGCQADLLLRLSHFVVDSTIATANSLLHVLLRHVLIHWLHHGHRLLDPLRHQHHWLVADYESKRE
jgi:hypothetical protein